MTLVEFLRAQLDKEERIAREAADGDSGEWFMGDRWNIYRAEDQTPSEDDEANRLVVWGNVKSQSEHIACHDPARVLREVEAKRVILTEHRDDGYGNCTGCGMNAREEMCNPLDDCPTLLALAKVYESEPDFNPDWRV